MKDKIRIWLLMGIFMTACKSKPTPASSLTSPYHRVQIDVTQLRMQDTLYLVYDDELLLRYRKIPEAGDRLEVTFHDESEHYATGVLRFILQSHNKALIDTKFIIAKPWQNCLLDFDHQKVNMNLINDTLKRTPDEVHIAALQCIGSYNNPL
jgi:hypothetical protein